MSKEPQLGTLIVVVLKARNLIDKHSFYKQDVFAQASLNGAREKTHVEVKGGQHPVWDTEFRFPVMKEISDKTRKLEISCFAKEHRSDDILGKGIVDITGTLRTGEFDDWIGLDIDGVVRGEVYLEMTYFSSEPPPVISTTSSLAAPPNQKPTKRPSKLSPSERLYRPHQQPSSHQPSSAGAHPQGSASAGRPSVVAPLSSSRSTDSTLPPLPEHQSGQISLHGRATWTKLQESAPNSGPPSILRPGKGYGSIPNSRPPDRAHRPSPSPPPPSSNPRPARHISPPYAPSSYMNSDTPNPYLAKPTTASATTPVVLPSTPQPTSAANYGSYISQAMPSSTPSAWAQHEPTTSTTSFSFPVPMMVVAPQPDLHPAGPYQNYGSHQAIRDDPLFSRPDPDPESWYENLSPLYPGTVALPTSRPPHDQQPGHNLDTNRLEALKQAEEEANQRREQEQRDLELALQLDKELNT